MLSRPSGVCGRCAISSRDLGRVRVDERRRATRVPATASSSSREHDTREARRERGAQPAVGRAVPPLRAARRSRRSMRASLPAGAPGTCASESIMHLPMVARRPLSRDRLEHGIRVVHGLHRQHRRRAAREQLGGREPRRRRAATPACAPLPSARRAGAASRAAADRRRSRGTASGTDACASGRSPAARNRRRIDDPIVRPVGCGAERGDPAVANRHVARRTCRSDRSSSGRWRCGREETRGEDTTGPWAGGRGRGLEGLAKRCGGGCDSSCPPMRPAQSP